MTTARTDEPRVLARSEHKISRKNIDPNAIKVLYRLRSKGYKAYLVGGSVRDLLLDRKPKDFDISTDARPNEMRRLFRNSRIIGRRFRLAHVYFRDGIVEVATFRRDPDPQAQASAPHELLITDDNVFGTPREDAFRRDFTVNAVFYNVADFTVIDYVGGVDDLEHQVIRTIGDPEVRFQEDPVRMMRACEYAGRLGFTIEESAQRAIEEHHREIRKAAAPRMAEEVSEMLGSGAAGAALQWMSELHLLKEVLPEVHELMTRGGEQRVVLARVIKILDRRAASQRPLSAQMRFAAVLLPLYLDRRGEREDEKGGLLKRGALKELAADIGDPFAARFALSRLKAEQIRQGFLGMQRIERARWSDVERVRFTGRPYFDDAFALYEIYGETTRRFKNEIEAWRRAIRHRPGGGAKQLPKPAQHKPRRRRRRRGR